MTKKALQQEGNTMNKRINSYNRLLNAGFIKKEVFDNRVKNLQKGPPLANHNAGQSANHRPPPSLANQNAGQSANHRPPPSLANHNASLADHILSMKAPISNASGHYPCNGAPGRSLR
jgi:hypothetical protein